MAAEQPDLTHVFGYTDTNYLEIVARLMAATKRRVVEELRLEAGARVLDVGCGPATDTIAFAQIVGPQGSVVGLDHDPAMLAAANDRAALAGVADWTQFQQGDAAQLPFSDGAFDVVHAERIFMHLSTPERALHEMVRVTAPGGRLVILEPDWATLSVASDEVALERRFAHLWASLLPHGIFARRLKGLCCQAGLTGVAVVPLPIQVTDYGLVQHLYFLERTLTQAHEQGIFTQEETDRLLASWQREVASEGFLVHFLNLLVSGSLPASS